MITRVQFWPHPPALFVELTGSAAGELSALRAALAASATELADLDVVVILGTGPAPGLVVPGTSGSLAGFGANVLVDFPHLVTEDDEVAADLTTVTQGLGANLAALPRLPLPLLVAARVLSDAGLAVPCIAVCVGNSADEVERVTKEVVRAASESAHRVGLVVMGDGSAGRAANSPGYIIDGAIEYDDAVLRALGSADLGALANLDPETGRRVMAAGAEIWPAVGQAMAGVEAWQGSAGDGPGGTSGNTGDIAADRSDSAFIAAEPFVDDSLGVLYVVAGWQRS